MTGDPIVLEVVGIPASQGPKSKMPNGVVLDGSTTAARAKLKAWRGGVTDAARAWLTEHPQPPLAEPIRLVLTFRFPPTKSDPYRTLHCTFPDLNHCVRSTEDALVKAGLLADDRLVWSSSEEKRYALANEHVGATVQIEPWGWYEAQQREVKKAEAAAARRAS